MVLMVSTDGRMQGVQGSNPTDDWKVVGEPLHVSRYFLFITAEFYFMQLDQNQRFSY